MLAEVDYAFDNFRTNMYDAIQHRQQKIYYYRGTASGDDLL